MHFSVANDMKCLQVSLGVTALLSMAIIMMMVADEMPATSDVMPLIGTRFKALRFIRNSLNARAKTLVLTRNVRYSLKHSRQVLHWPHLHPLPRCLHDNTDVERTNARYQRHATAASS